jgi:hypothetical protein
MGIGLVVVLLAMHAPNQPIASKIRLPPHSPWACKKRPTNFQQHEFYSKYLYLPFPAPVVVPFANGCHRWLGCLR